MYRRRFTASRAIRRKRSMTIFYCIPFSFNPNIIVSYLIPWRHTNNSLHTVVALLGSLWNECQFALSLSSTFKTLKKFVLIRRYIAQVEKYNSNVVQMTPSLFGLFGIMIYLPSLASVGSPVDYSFLSLTQLHIKFRSM